LKFVRHLLNDSGDELFAIINLDFFRRIENSFVMKRKREVMKRSDRTTENGKRKMENIRIKNFHFPLSVFRWF